MALHQYPSAETFPSSTTYPGQWPDPNATLPPIYGWSRKIKRIIQTRPNA